MANVGNIAVGIGLDTINPGGDVSKDNDARSEKSATQSEWTKRKTEPRTKSIDSRIQTDNVKLDKFWTKVH